MTYENSGNRNADEKIINGIESHELRIYVHVIWSIYERITERHQIVLLTKLRPSTLRKCEIVKRLVYATHECQDI